MAIQDHMHLSTTVSGTGEKAPTLKWYTIDRELEWQTIGAVKRSSTGKVFRHALSSGGNPIRFENYSYVVILRAEQSQTIDQRIAALKALLYQYAYLVDHDHVADGADHTSYVKAVVVEKIGALKKVEPMLARYYVPIILTDNFTVS